MQDKSTLNIKKAKQDFTLRTDKVVGGRV